MAQQRLVKRGAHLIPDRGARIPDLLRGSVGPMLGAMQAIGLPLSVVQVGAGPVAEASVARGEEGRANLHRADSALAAAVVPGGIGG